MVDKGTFRFASEAKPEDGTDIHTFYWLPEDPKRLKAMIQISHGMAEHAGRYDAFSNFLVERGFGVYANDHRGHGLSARSEDDLGYMGDGDGWLRMVDDMASLTKIIHDKHPGLPTFLIGHSMGSMLTRHYLLRCPGLVDGYVLSGTAGNPGPILHLGQFIAKMEGRMFSRKRRSKLLNAMSFGSFNRAMKPVRTPFDWLSRDNAMVDRYIADPLCGKVFTAGYYEDFFRGLMTINSDEYYAKISKQQPMLFFAGDMDPVGGFGKDVQKLVDRFRASGCSDIELILYEGGRHEMFNETNRAEVYADVLEWLEKQVPASK